MKHSCAKVFCSRSGARSGPVKKGDSTRCERTRSLRITPAPLAESRTRPAMYDGAVLKPLSSGVSGAGAGVRGANGAGLEPTRNPVTTLPGVL